MNAIRSHRKKVLLYDSPLNNFINSKKEDGNRSEKHHSQTLNKNFLQNISNRFFSIIMRSLEAIINKNLFKIHNISFDEGQFLFIDRLYLILGGFFLIFQIFLTSKSNRLFFLLNIILVYLFAFHYLIEIYCCLLKDFVMKLKFTITKTRSIKGNEKIQIEKLNYSHSLTFIQSTAVKSVIPEGLMMDCNDDGEALSIDEIEGWCDLVRLESVKLFFPFLDPSNKLNLCCFLVPFKILILLPKLVYGYLCLWRGEMLVREYEDRFGRGDLLGLSLSLSSLIRSHHPLPTIKRSILQMLAKVQDEIGTDEGGKGSERSCELKMEEKENDLNVQESIIHLSSPSISPLLTNSNNQKNNMNKNDENGYEGKIGCVEGVSSSSHKGKEDECEKWLKEENLILRNQVKDELNTICSQIRKQRYHPSNQDEPLQNKNSTILPHSSCEHKKGTRSINLSKKSSKKFGPLLQELEKHQKAENNWKELKSIDS